MFPVPVQGYARDQSQCESAGKTKQLSFTVTAGRPGTYLVQIGGLREYFTVGATGSVSAMSIFLNSRIWIILDILALILIAILVTARDHDPEQKRKKVD